LPVHHKVTPRYIDALQAGAYSMTVFDRIKCSSSGSLTTSLDPDLDKDVTLDELQEAIKKLAKCKAPGSDGIPHEVWTNLFY
jgi:hypothetical protein